MGKKKKSENDNNQKVTITDIKEYLIAAVKALGGYVVAISVDSVMENNARESIAGQVEILNPSLRYAETKTYNSNFAHWDEFVSTILDSMRIKQSARANKTLYELIFRIKSRLPVNELKPGIKSKSLIAIDFEIVSVTRQR
ncbi:hypothetical protein BB561_005577 [Smittium simulii]|uniref:Uncharacterized protein n=1 Tax=Smittium simulii TaxID=133385 RepID=A0A2T9Y9L9_9FUNG|nr:hypothetical protein BB561_005577 [Smittium simulii]